MMHALIVPEIVTRHVVNIIIWIEKNTTHVHEG